MFSQTKSSKYTQYFKIENLSEPYTCDVNAKFHQITITIFTDCNLSCRFCYEYDRTPISEDLWNYDNIIKNFELAVSKIKAPLITISVIGGELLQDKFDNDMIEKYTAFFNQLKTILTKHNKQFKISINSNLIHLKRERWVELFTNVGVDIFASYDCHGRFGNKKQRTLFFNNFDYYHSKQLIKGCDIVLSKSNIESFLSLSKYYDDLVHIYNNTKNIIFNCYTTDPHNINNDDNPSKDLISKFYLFLYHNFEKCSTIEGIIKDKKIVENHPMCFSTMIYPNALLWTCCDPKKKSEFIINKKCFVCDYYRWCNSTACYRTQCNGDVCFLQKIYDNLKLEPEVIWS